MTPRFSQVSNRAKSRGSLASMTYMVVTPAFPHYENGTITEFRVNITITSTTSNQQHGKGLVTVAAIPSNTTRSKCLLHCSLLSSSGRARCLPEGRHHDHGPFGLHAREHQV